MVIQIFIFAWLFIGLSVWFYVKKRKPLAVTFILMGVFAMAFFFIVRWLYPHTAPF